MWPRSRAWKARSRGRAGPARTANSEARADLSEPSLTAPTRLCPLVRARRGPGRQGRPLRRYGFVISIWSAIGSSNRATAFGSTSWCRCPPGSCSTIQPRPCASVAASSYGGPNSRYAHGRASTLRAPAPTPRSRTAAISAAPLSPPSWQTSRLIGTSRYRPFAGCQGLDRGEACSTRSSGVPMKAAWKGGVPCDAFDIDCRSCLLCCC
jgi:hypothetical protein